MNNKYLNFFWLCIKPYLKLKILIFMLVLMLTGLQLLQPLIMKLLIDKALTSADFKLLYILLSISIGLVVIRSIFNILHEYCFGFFQHRLAYDLRVRIYKRLIFNDVLFFQKKGIGDLLNRIINEMGDVVALFSSTLIRFFREIVTFLGTLIIMLFLSWQLTILVALTIPLIVISMRYFNPKLQKANHALMVNYSETSDLLQENLHSVRLYKTFHKEIYSAIRFSKVLRTLFSSQMSLIRTRIFNQQILFYIYSIPPTLLMVIGGSMVIKGIITIGTFVALFSYLDIFFSPIRNLSTINVELQRTFVAFKRYYELYFSTERSSQDEGKKKKLEKINQCIELDKVSFAYSTDHPLVLENFSLKIKPGEIVGLAGSNGVGKSTIIGLMSNVYTPSMGDVRLDNYPLNQIKISSLKNIFGVVHQEPFMLNVTIMDNILLGRKISKEKISELADVLNLDIQSFPNGYDTLLEKNGQNISGGQRQKIGIIRAFVHNPQIIILDEATSSIDEQTEKSFFNWLLHNKKDKIIVFITHKMELLDYADKVVQLNEINQVMI